MLHILPFNQFLHHEKEYNKNRNTDKTNMQRFLMYENIILRENWMGTLRFHAWNCWTWKLKEVKKILNQGGAHIYLQIVCGSIETKNVWVWNVALTWHQQPFGDFICCWIRWCTNQKMYIWLVQMVELFMLKRQK